MDSSKILIIIPARYESKRLPGKPLLKISGIEMIKRVANLAIQVCKEIEHCSYIIATDDKRIVDFCVKEHLLVKMSSPHCKSGTERCWDIVSSLEKKPDFIINLQGDNPLCPYQFLIELINSWKSNSKGQVFTPFVHLSWDEFDSMKANKESTPFSGTTVLLDKNNYALAFSKNIIPAIRNESRFRIKNSKSPIRRHIGLYAYTLSALEGYFSMEQSPYEEVEGLEQMRFLHNNIPIKMVEVSYMGKKNMSGIDSPEDIKRAEIIIMEWEQE